MTNLLHLITPTNIDEEKDKFFTSNSYNPIFTYPWEHLELPISTRSPKKRKLYQAIVNQDHNAITNSASDLFEVKIDPETLTLARQEVQNKRKVSSGTAIKFIKLLHSGLNFFNLQEIEIILTDSPAYNARPDHMNNKLYVSKYAHFEYFSMEGGVRHDLVHVIRYKNGIHNKIKRSPRYLPTEEGLASWCQDHTNSDSGLAQHAAEYLGSAIGVKGSLRDIFSEMRSIGLSPELAWKRSIRHKFGFKDTSRAGDIFKPAMYFANEIKVDKLSTNEKVRLFVGKINQDELPEYPIYNGNWSTDQIISYFHLE